MYSHNLFEADRGLNINSTINMQSDSAAKAPEKVCYTLVILWKVAVADGRRIEEYSYNNCQDIASCDIVIQRAMGVSYFSSQSDGLVQFLEVMGAD